jgi:hypothetical protein
MHNAFDKEHTPSLVNFKIMITDMADTAYGFDLMLLISSDSIQLAFLPLLRSKKMQIRIHMHTNTRAHTHTHTLTHSHTHTCAYSITHTIHTHAP